MKEGVGGEGVDHHGDDPREGSAGSLIGKVLPGRRKPG